MPILIHGNSKVPELQQKNVKSTTVQQEITPSEGYDGFNKIIVSPIILQEKTVDVWTMQQEVVADTGYDGLSKVIVNALNFTASNLNGSSINDQKSQSADGTTLYVRIPKSTFSGIRINSIDDVLLLRVLLQGDTNAENQIKEQIFNIRSKTALGTYGGGCLYSRYSGSASAATDEADYSQSPSLASSFAPGAEFESLTDKGTYYEIQVKSTNTNRKYNTEQYYLWQIIGYTRD